MNDTLEVWMRGPVDGVPRSLQPAAHALLQASEEVLEIMASFPDAALWSKPAGLASAGFHLQHLTGVLDRLFTYARAEKLNEEQLKYLKNEGVPNSEITTQLLVGNFTRQVIRSVDYLRTVNEDTLYDFRGIGRKMIPGNVIGLLFHAAEHSQRHVGQLLVTARIVTQS